MKRIAITFLTMITLAGSVFAQVPRGFNYQMVVRNTNGQLVSESIVRLVLSIRQGTPTGPVVYQLTDTPQTNTNGLVTLVVGTGSDSASYDAINWANGPYFLVCEVDPTGGSNYALRTEQQILSVPYAAYATTADRVSQSFTYNEQDPKFSNWGYDYDSLVGAPARLSEFINDLPQVTSLPWDSITGHPTALSQFTNDLPQVTSLPWDSISGHPTALSQFTNDLPQVTSLPWDSITGRPTSLSQLINDGGYLTAETQTLADVMALGNNANGLVITNLGDPTSPYDVANKHYVDDAMATERIILNNRIDSLRSALDSLRVAYDSLRNSQGSSIDSVSTNLYDYQHRLVAGELEGVFSVGTSKQVRFSSGNLQYRPRTKTWRFALSQNGYIGTENNYISNPYYADWIDLFGYGTSGWSSGATTLGNPTSTSTNDVEYTESTDGDDLTGMYANADWGFYNPIINGGNQMGTWRTLTHSEWIYLLNDRPNASSLRGLATVGSKSGYIILPDNWTLPATESFDPTATNYITNNYDDDHWAIMEAAGAVFLPSAGYRTASATAQNGVEGHYWTSTHVNGTLSNSIKIAIPTGATSDPANCSKGYSVRLVRDY